MSDSMSCTESSSTNAILRRAVKAEVECGQNWMGATSTVAAFLGIPTRTVRARCRDELTGAPRRHLNLEEMCWAFLDAVAKRQRAWLRRLEDEIETRKAGDVEANLATAADSLARANDALADYEMARGVRK